jgi:hypothetical protein
MLQMMTEAFGFVEIAISNLKNSYHFLQRTL